MSFRNCLCFFLTATSFSALSLFADIDALDLSSENIEQVDSGDKRSPVTFQMYCDFISDTKIRKGYYKGDYLEFSEAEAELGFVFYYCPAYTEGASAAISYIPTKIKWKENPWFDQDHFHTASLSFTSFTQRLPGWFWRGQFTLYTDAQQWDLEQYTWYDIILWGRYTYLEELGLHVGMIAETGMRMDRIYPILGADWQVSKRWKLNLVFPVNVSLEYLITEKWAVALAGRTFNSRHRVAPNEANGRSLVRYENTGAEFAVKFNGRYLTANIHAGSTLGGRYRIADKRNHHPHTYKLDPSGYVGAELELHF